MNLTPEERLRRSDRIRQRNANETPEKKAYRAAKLFEYWHSDDPLIVARREAAKKNQLAALAAKKLAKTKMSATATAPTTPEAPTAPARIIDISEGAGHANGAADKPNRENKSKRIHWTPAEMRAVADKTAELMKKQGIAVFPEGHDKTTSAFILDFLRIAQSEALPRHRRRLSANGKNSFSDFFWEILKNSLAALAQKSEPIAAVPAPPGAALVATNAAPPPALPPIPPGTSNTLLEMIPTAQLLAYVGARLDDQMKQLRDANEMLLEDVTKLQQENKALGAAFANAINATAPSEPEKKKRTIVAILGCYKHQFDSIAEGAAGAGLDLDLRHYDQEQRPKDFLAEYAISMRFLRHSWNDKAHEAVPTGRYMFLPGGTSSVINQLKAWFDK